MKLITLLLILSSFLSAQRIKFATVAPKGSAWYNVMDEFADAVEKQTKGKVNFKIYGGGTQGDEITVLKRMRVGQIHAGGFIGPGLGQIVPEVRILDLPLMFKNYSEVDYVLEHTFELFQAKFAEKGYHLLAWSEAGFVNMYSSEHIANFSDLSKAKMFSLSGDPVADLTFDALGLSPQKIPLTDVLTALNTGDINTTYTPPMGELSLQWFRKQKYLLDINLAYSSGAVIISNEQWEKISPENQKIVTEMAKIYFKKFKEVGRKANAESQELMLKDGLTRIEFTDLGPFIEASKKARKAAVGQLFDQKLLDTVEALILESRKTK